MKRFCDRSLVFQQCFYFLSCMTLVLLVIGTIASFAARRILAKEIDGTAEIAVQGTIARIEQPIVMVEHAVRNLAAEIEMGEFEPERMKMSLELMLDSLRQSHRSIYGGSLAFAGADASDRYPALMYYCYFGEDGILSTKALGGKEYPYQEMSWFAKPAATGKLTWVEPYFDKGAGDVMMTTCSMPLFLQRDEKKHFIGVVTVDLDLRSMSELVSSCRVNESGQTLLLSQAGRFLAHPDPEFDKELSLMQRARRQDNPELCSVAADIRAGKGGKVRISNGLKMSSGAAMFYYAPVRSTLWSVCVLFPESELFAPLLALERQIIGICALGLLMVLVLIVAVSRQVTRPLLHLSRAAGEIGRGNFSASLPYYKRGDEVGILSRSFERMQTELTEHIRRSVAEAAERQSMESQLKIAREIQLGILPRRPLPGGGDFQLAAVLEPAKMVGGDLYDVFFTDPDHLFLIAGDVSGKGIPAALFMGIIQTLQRSECEKDLPPGELVSRINRHLAANNDSMMFVTYFLAMVDLKTGMMTYVNGGHNPPCILRADGQVSWLEECHGGPLAVFDDAYESSRLQLNPGDGIFLYTDGVTEAMNPAREQYGDDALIALLRQYAAGHTPEEIVAFTMASVQKFADGAEQSDDITMLCFRLLQPRG